MTPELRGYFHAPDDRGLLVALNEGIHGNMGGMGRSSLYEKAKFGTKQLIVDYVDEVVSALQYLADPRVDDIDFAEKLDFFRRADHCFGHSAFMMSGSGSLFYFHIGVVRALLDQGLLPNVLSGSSGGAFVGSLLSTHSRTELDDLLDPERLIDRMEEETGHLRRSSRLRPRVMRVEEIQTIVESLVPDLTFEEALNLTVRELNISVAPAETHQKSRLLNAITTPNVLIREAVLASAAAVVSAGSWFCCRPKSSAMTFLIAALMSPLPKLAVAIDQSSSSAIASSSIAISSIGSSLPSFLSSLLNTPVFSLALSSSDSFWLGISMSSIPNETPARVAK